MKLKSLVNRLDIYLWILVGALLVAAALFSNIGATQERYSDKNLIPDEVLGNLFSSLEKIEFDTMEHYQSEKKIHCPHRATKS